MLKCGVLVIFVASSLLAGCGRVSVMGSGDVVTREEAVADFDSLDVSHGFEVDVRQGDEFSVVIRVDDNLIDHVRVAKDGSTLEIGLQDVRTEDLKNATLEAEIVMPELSGLDLRHGSWADIDGFSSTKALVASLTGGSHLDGDVEAGDATFKVGSGSHATVSGSAGDLVVEASGGSHAKLGDLTVVDAAVDASGGSHVTVRPTGTLDVVARGGSDVTYVGNPTLGSIDADYSSAFKGD